MISKAESVYIRLGQLFGGLKEASIPYFRRFIRFLALPYCYFRLVDWRECDVGYMQVAKDLSYIFFKLKYFPDNYSVCRLWEKNRDQWKYYYGSIYEPYQRARLRKEVQKAQYKILFEDKYICYQLCRSANIPTPEVYDCIEPEFNEKYKEIISNRLSSNQSKKLIIKPTLGSGGRNIYIVEKHQNTIIVNGLRGSIDLENFKLCQESILQECVCQHPRLDAISTSINTLRIVTLLDRQKNIIIVGAIMRFGREGSFVDNTSQGGVAAGIDLDSGSLKKFAFDSGGKKYLLHPDSDFIFHNFKIPVWSEAVELAKLTQRHFTCYKMLGLDIALTLGGPTLLEINEAHDNVGLERSYGPILASADTLAAFKEYNLLINDSL